MKGVALDGEDEVVSLDVVSEGAMMLCVSEQGLGKRSPLEEYRLQSRGGKGILTMHLTERTAGWSGSRRSPTKTRWFWSPTEAG